MASSSPLTPLLPVQLQVTSVMDFTESVWATAMTYLVGELNALNALQPSIVNALSNLQAIGLTQINNSLSPVYSAMSNYANLGAILTATSFTVADTGLGTLTLTIPANECKQFAPAVMLSVQSTVTPSIFMLGSLVSYNNITGVLIVDITVLNGSGSGIGEWTIAPCPSSSSILSWFTSSSAYTSRAPINAPVFTGVPTAPTAAPSTNTLQLATTAFVTAAISAAVGGGGNVPGGGSSGQALVNNGSGYAWSTLAKANISDLGTIGSSAQYDVGTSAGDIVRLLTGGKLPAIDGSNLTNVVTSGALLNSNNLSDVSNTASALFNLGAAPLNAPTFTGVPAAPTASSGTNTTQLATCAFVTAATSSGTARNVIQRSGSFDMWQRSTGFTASIGVAASTTKYTADGWYIKTGASQACTIACVAGISSNPFKACKVQRNYSQTGVGSITFGMPLDEFEVPYIAGQYVALSFTIKAGANWSPTSGDITVKLNTGTGTPVKFTAGYTASSPAISETVAITTTPTLLSYVSSSAVGSTVTQAEVTFTWTPVSTAGVDDSFTVDDVQLEVVAGASSSATQFHLVDFRIQRLLAQSHFWKSYPYAVAPGTSCTDGTANLSVGGYSYALGLIVLVPFPVPMRAAPSVVIYDCAGTQGDFTGFNANTKAWNDGIAGATTQATSSILTINDNDTIGAYYGMNCDATADAGI